MGLKRFVKVNDFGAVVQAFYAETEDGGGPNDAKIGPEAGMIYDSTEVNPKSGMPWVLEGETITPTHRAWAPFMEQALADPDVDGQAAKKAKSMKELNKCKSDAKDKKAVKKAAKAGG